MHHMNIQHLQQYIMTILPMSPDKAKFFAEQFEYVELDKDAFLIQENKKCKYTFYLEEGYIRSLTADSMGNEVTTNIFSSDCFVNDFLAFFKQAPANENFQALTNCKIWRMDFETVQNNFHAHLEFREFGRLMLVTNYAILHERMLGMIKKTAEQRYSKLLEKHPAIFQNVPLKIIASYLGITDTSLSRIRKEVAQK